MSLGNRIRKLRLTKGYRQADLAKITKIAASTISQYEGDKKIPKCNELNNIAKALGTTSEHLINVDNTTDTDKVILSLFKCLSDKNKEYALSYINYLLSQKSRG